jgi:hypothetical protein
VINNNKLLTTFLILLALVLSACGGGSSGGDDPAAGGGNSSGATTGMITLTGVDTASVGSQLNTGFIGSSLAAASLPDYIVIVDQNSTVTFTEPNMLTPVLADPLNGFVLVVTDDSASGGPKALSMDIYVGGVEYAYTCTTLGVPIDCGASAITLDIGSKTITLNDAVVENKVSKTTLTLAGSLTW